MSSPVEVINTINVIAIKGPEGELGEDQGFLSKVKQFFLDLSDSMKNREYAFEVFEKNFLFLKSFGLAFLIILAVVNYVYYKNSGLIHQKPLMFFIESCVFGLSGVVPFLLLCFLRNNGRYNSQQIINISIGLFFVFFIANYLMELSGIYPTLFQKEDESGDNSDQSQKEDNSSFGELKTSFNTTSDIIVLTIFGVSLFSLFFATAFIRDTSPNYVEFNSVSPLVIFIVEMLLFGIISAVPIFLMASNRDVLSGNTFKEFILIVIKFSLLHCLLQLSGFYSYIF